MKPILALFLFSSLTFSASLTVGARACVDIFCDVAPATVSGRLLFAGAVGIGAQIAVSGPNSQGTAWEATAAAVIDYGVFHGGATGNFSTLVPNIVDGAGGSATALWQGRIRAEEMNHP